MPDGNGLATVALIVLPPELKVLVMGVVMALTGEAKGPSCDNDGGRYEMPYPARITLCSVMRYAKPTRGEKSFRWRLSSRRDGHAGLLTRDSRPTSGWLCPVTGF